jgi:Holliday junction resolvase RusA-like endonuclease
MKMTTAFFVPMTKIPTTTHQQKKVAIRFGKPIFYEPQELKDARAIMMGYLSPHVPATPYKRSVRLMVKWCFPLQAKTKEGQWKTTKPDLDNSLKLVQDCMTKLKFWSDDSIVVSLMAEKVFSEPSGIYIQIDEV